MRLTGLHQLHRDLHAKTETYCIFKFIKNRVEFDIFFDVGSSPFKLGFLVIRSNFELWLNVEKGFIIDVNLKREDYKQLINLLNLKFSKDNKFSTFAFFEEFNSKIPSSVPHIQKAHAQNLFVRYFKLEEEDKLFYDGAIEWDKTEIKKRRRPENLEKTRLLLPKLYKRIKDKNISIRYTSIPNDYVDN